MKSVSTIVWHEQSKTQTRQELETQHQDPQQDMESSKFQKRRWPKTFMDIYPCLTSLALYHIHWTVPYLLSMTLAPRGARRTDMAWISTTSVKWPPSQSSTA